MTKQQLDDSKELASRDRIVPLAAIDQPLADKLHNIIKAQNEAIIASRKAVAHVLRRISDDALLHAHMGVATQSFDLLTEAASLLFAETKTQVCETFLPCSSAIHCRS